MIQACAPTSNAEEDEQFYEDLQDLLELTPKRDVLFIIGDWNTKVGSQEIPAVMGKFNSGDHYIYYCGQESLRRNGLALIVNKRA